MSFNCVEVARAAELINGLLPDRVRSVELARFALGSGAELSDLNVALWLENSRKVVIFSLQSPWVGLFVADSNAVKPAKSRSVPWIHDLISHIQGQSLTTVDVPEGERVTTLKFEAGIELDVELIPARPNWVLRTGRHDAAAGPDGPALTASFSNEQRWRESLLRPMSARSPESAQFVAREFDAPAGDLSAWMAAAFAHYRALREKQLLLSKIQAASAQLLAKAAHVAKVRGQMRGALAESTKAEALRKQAEVLKARLYEFEPGKKAGLVPGLEGEPDVELDRRFTIAENVTRMFARYKKLQRTQKEVQARMAGVEEEGHKLASAVARIRAFKGDLAAFNTLALELGLAGAAAPSEGPKKTKSKEEKKWAKLVQNGVRRFESKEGLAIWIGRNHKENEELVVRLARGNDIWVHLKGRPGAHGVIQLPSGKTPSLETLLDAATLVAYYSGVVEKEKAEIDYTPRKYVKRVPGVGGGKFLVTYSQNKTLMLKMEEPRLWRLLKQHS